MTGSFTSRLADIEEAGEPLQKDKHGILILAGKRAKTVSTSGLSWVVLAGILIILVTLNRMANADEIAAQTDITPRQDMIALRIIALCPLIFLATCRLFPRSRFVQSTNNDSQARSSRRWALRGTIIMLVIGAMTVTALFLANMPSLRLDWRLTRGEIMVIGLLPWIIVSALLVPTLMRTARLQQRLWWEANNLLHDAFDISIDENGIRFKNRFTDKFFHWNCFTHVHETMNLFVLKGFTTHEQYIVPKRAFPDPSDDLVLRALFVTHVPQALLVEQPHGFPVAVAS